MRDNFKTFKPHLNTPAENAFTITIGTEFNYATRAIYVGVGGDVEIITIDGTTVLFKNAQSGQIIPVRARNISASNTTATDLVGLY